MTGAGVTVDSDEVLRDQLDGWRSMARSILAAAGMPVALVARLDARPALLVRPRPRFPRPARVAERLV